MTDNAILDAQDHFKHEKPLLDYKCMSCGERFGHRHGITCGDEEFCNECVKHNKHILFYRKIGISDEDIYRVVSRSADL